MSSTSRLMEVVSVSEKMSRAQDFSMATDRLRLSPFSQEDLTYLHGLWTNPSVRKYLWDDVVVSHQLVADTIRASQQCFREHGFGFWVLRVEEGQIPVGFAGLRHYGVEDDVELLYGLAPSHWGRGLATEAARRVLRFGFEILTLPVIHAGTDPPNQASLNVIERLGMRFRERRWIDGVEAVYFEITRDQWDSR